MSKSTYLRFDGMSWPNPNDPGGVEWALRYGAPTKTQLLIAASFIGAYRQLITDAQRIRNQKIKQLRQSVESTSADANGAEVTW